MTRYGMNTVGLHWKLPQRLKSRASLKVSPGETELTSDSRTRLQEMYLHRLATYISSPLSNPDEGNAMAAFLDSPRAEILNLNTLDEKSGTSLLHESSR
jgi:hypothetical protein